MTAVDAIGGHESGDGHAGDAAEEDDEVGDEHVFLPPCRGGGLPLRWRPGVDSSVIDSLVFVELLVEVPELGLGLCVVVHSQDSWNGTFGLRNADEGALEDGYDPELQGGEGNAVSFHVDEDGIGRCARIGGGCGPEDGDANGGDEDALRDNNW